MNYYQHHIGDFIRDTARLSDAQCMAYLRMIWMYYETEQPLTSNIKVLSLKLGCDADDVVLLLEAFFKHDGDVWRHARCDRELEAFKRMSDGGKQGAAKRWSKGGDNPPIATPMPPQCIPNANQEPITNNHIEEAIASSKGATKKSPRFDPRDLPLPLGLKAGKWDEWVSYRSKARKALSESTATKQLEFLADCIANGFDAGAIIDESIRNGWQGLFEPKGYAQQSNISAKFDPTRYVNDPDYRNQVDGHQTQDQGGEHGRVIDVTPQRMA